MNYRRHRDRWKKCRECDLHKTRKNVVLARGVVPCDVMFTGEAPASSEDTLGKPFVGPAGQLLDKMIAEAMKAAFGDEEKPTTAFTNLVCCIPLDDSHHKVHQPPAESIKACGPRLNEFVELADPRMVVVVGRLAAKWFPKMVKFDTDRIAEIAHPAGLMRMDITQKGLQIQKNVVALADALEEME